MTTPAPIPELSALERLLTQLRQQIEPQSPQEGLLHQLQTAIAQLRHTWQQAADDQRAEIAHLQAQLEQQQGYLRHELETELLYKKLIGNSPAMRRLRQTIEQVAPTDSTVLITGETGTGKELIARAIHEQSPRRRHLLVKVNCAALASGVLASELFGHEAGAFTGAVKKRLGRFELAHQGTLFLDEIAEMSAETQVLLLRVLQERTFERVGGNEPITVDVRVLAATNRDLATEVAEGRFRADLFYRLNVFPIRVPPLRERTEDIPALLHHFRLQVGRRVHKQVSQVDPQALELAQRYPWPGNVRELENIVERALIVATGDVLSIDPTWLAALPKSPAAVDPAGLAGAERRLILDTLERCGGRIYGPTGAAVALGLKPSTLYGKMRKHHIRKQTGSPHYE